VSRARVRGLHLVLALLLVIAFVPTATGRETRAADSPIALQLVLDGFTKPVYVADAGDESRRLFVVEKRGLIRIVRDGKRVKEPFLDLRSFVKSDSNEQGLLSLAFHPIYAKNGRFFVAYTDLNGDLVVARYEVSPADPDLADPTSEVNLLLVPKPYDDHNGGLVLFGPDGYLYLSVGDGGAKAEPARSGQDLKRLLGKIVRIDVDHAEGGHEYAIPSDNPFVGVPGVRPEIWAYGLRNPWRFSFDRELGDLFIADVGLWMKEEVDIHLAGTPGGQNYGWNYYEGSICHQSPDTGYCEIGGLTHPVATYDHGQDCAIIGGYVYRGTAIPDLVGTYLLGDICSGQIKQMKRTGETWAITELLSTPLSITSFGEDAQGELYVTDLEGGLYRVVKRTSADRNWLAS
jgi:glucose/arabinose dehydrogenase